MGIVIKKNKLQQLGSCNNEKSPIGNVINDNKVKNYVDNFVKINEKNNVKKIDASDNQTYIFNNVLLQKFYDEIPVSHEKSIGKHFNIIYDKRHTERFSYWFTVETLYIPDKKKKILYLKDLDYVEEKIEDSKYKATYFIDGDIEENIIERQVFVIDFDLESNDVYVNVGIIGKKSLKLSKKPILMSNSVSFIKRKNIIDCLKVENDNNSNNENDNIKEVLYDIDVLLFDAESGKPVPYKLYYDSKKNKYMKQYEQQCYRSYFLAYMTPDNGQEKLSIIDLANATLLGTKSLSKDLIKAVRYLEDENTAESLLYLSNIFFNDKKASSEDLAIEYLNKACGKKSEMALITRYILTSDADELFLKNIINKDVYSDKGLFARAVYLEETDKEKSAQIYEDLYRKGDVISAIRLMPYISRNEEEYTLNIEEFINEKVDDGYKELAMGYLLLNDERYIARNKYLAVKMLEQSALKGNIYAMYELIVGNYKELYKFRGTSILPAYHKKILDSGYDNACDLIDSIEKDKNDKEFDQLIFAMLNYACEKYPDKNYLYGYLAIW